MNIVKELRKKAGIQQKELAIQIGVSRPTVSEWEANKKDPSGPRLKKLAEFFNVDELVILGKGIVDLNAGTKETPEADAVQLLNNQGSAMLQKFHRLSPENQIRLDAYLDGLLSSQET